MVKLRDRAALWIGGTIFIVAVVVATTSEGKFLRLPFLSLSEKIHLAKPCDAAISEDIDVLDIARYDDVNQVVSQSSHDVWLYWRRIIVGVLGGHQPHGLIRLFGIYRPCASGCPSGYGMQRHDSSPHHYVASWSFATVVDIDADNRNPIIATIGDIGFLHRKKRTQLLSGYVYTRPPLQGSNRRISDENYQANQFQGGFMGGKKLPKFLTLAFAGFLTLGFGWFSVRGYGVPQRIGMGLALAICGAIILWIGLYCSGMAWEDGAANRRLNIPHLSEQFLSVSLRGFVHVSSDQKGHI